MEEKILVKAHYPVKEELLKKKLILYNNERKILLLESNNRIKFPKETCYETDRTIEQLLNISIDEEKIIEIARLIIHRERLKSVNNKLKKISRKITHEYYAYSVEFNSDIINQIWNSFYIRSENVLPYLIEMSQYLKLNVNNYDKEAVKILQKKLDYEGEIYVR